MHQVSHQTTLPRQEIIAELIKACHTAVLGWPALARMRWPLLTVADNDQCTRAKSSCGTQNSLRGRHNAQYSEGAGEREDMANRVMLMGGSGLSLSHRLRMLPTATHSSWENINQGRHKQQEKWVSMQKHHQFSSRNLLQLSFSSTGGAFQRQLYWYGTKHKAMLYTSLHSISRPPLYLEPRTGNDIPGADSPMLSKEEELPLLTHWWYLA